MADDVKTRLKSGMCVSFGLPPKVWRKVVELVFYLGAIAAPIVWVGSKSFEHFFGITARWFYLFSMQAFLAAWGLMLLQMVVHAFLLTRQSNSRL